MSPIDWAMRPLMNYANWTGRATRAEYWWFTLFSLVLSIVANVIDSLLGSMVVGTVGMISLVLALFLFIPSLMVSIRRLHDTDRSGLWLFIALIPLIGVIVLIVFFVSGGTSGTNRFGDNPYHYLTT